MAAWEIINGGKLIRKALCNLSWQCKKVAICKNVGHVYPLYDIQVFSDGID